MHHEASLPEPTDAQTVRFAPRRGERRERLRRRAGTAYGVMSVGLGLRRLVRTLRRRPHARHDWTVRQNGARQILSGIGMLASRRRAPWMWLRVGGDLLDLALLRSDIRATRRTRTRLGRAVALTAAMIAIDAVSARRSQRQTP